MLKLIRLNHFDICYLQNTRIESSPAVLYPTLNSAIESVTGTNVATISILRAITVPELQMTAATGYVINNKNISLVASGNNRSIWASAGDFTLFTINSGASLTLDATAGSTLTLSSINTTALANRRGVSVFGILTMNSAAISDFNNSGNGGGVFVNTGGTFNMSGNARVTPSTNNNNVGNNDVYLVDGPTINITGNLSGTSAVARITPLSHTVGRSVLTGNAVSPNYKRFVVTQPNGQWWIIDSAGTLRQNNGNADNPFIIRSKEDLLLIGTSPLLFTSFYQLDNDISISTPWRPIGTNTTSPTTATPFTGNFNGNGNTITFIISNLTGGNYGSSINYGLFNEIGINGNVRNLKITGNLGVSYGVDGFNNELNVGSVAGVNRGTIENVSSSVNVRSQNNKYYDDSSFANAGGIVGVNRGGIIKNCYSTGNVTAQITRPAAGGANAGGIAGYVDNSGSIAICWAIGTIEAVSNNNDNAFAGGIVGYINATGFVEHCVTRGRTINASGNSGNLNDKAGRIFGGENNGNFNNNFANSFAGAVRVNGSDVTGAQGDKNGGGISTSQLDSWTTGGPGWTLNTQNNANTNNPWYWHGVNACPILWFESSWNSP